MHHQDRKSAIDAYKNRKPAMGIFSVTCAATGQVWVGQSRNLDTQQNAIWFALRIGGGRYGALQPPWNTHGESAFSFCVLEQLAEDDALYPGDKLKGPAEEVAGKADRPANVNLLHLKMIAPCLQVHRGPLAT